MTYAETEVPGRDGLTDLSALALARLVRDGAVSAGEVVAAHLLRVSEVDGALNALVHVDSAAALATAAAIDETVRQGGAAGALAGVPFVVKDNVDVGGQVTASGSRSGHGLVALNDSPVVRRLRAHGAVLLGRANMDELAMGASTQTSAHGPTRNPVDRRRSPGGSSGGCAAAVAAGLAPLAIGSDTGGSIREPASQCGIVGMAPSPGLLPLDGVAPFAPELDRVGPMARDVADTAALLAAMASEPLRAGHVPRRVAVIEELAGPRNRPDVAAGFEAWLELVRAAGVEVVSVSVPDAPAALATYMTLTSLATLDWLEPIVRSGRAGEEVVRRYHLGLELRESGADQVDRALGVRTRLARQTHAALATGDLLVSPTMPTSAPLLFGEITAEELADPMAAPYTDCWTVVANLAGLPSLSVPAPTTGLPVGAMLMGRAGSDADLLALAGAL